MEAKKPLPWWKRLLGIKENKPVLQAPALRQGESGHWLCPHCGGNLARQEGSHLFFYGVPRRGMTDSAMVCPDCKHVSVPIRVPILGISAMDQLRAVYGDDSPATVEATLKNSNFKIVLCKDAPAAPVTEDKGGR